VGGENLETGLAREIYNKCGGLVEIYNEYGPTEATVGCMIHLFRPDEEFGSVPIGVPIANQRIYLLDRQLQPVVAGVPGEIFISGAGIARGYLNNEALTARKFLANPFVEGERMYRTGDLAVRLAGDTLLFRGRTDDQVKIRGFRIEPGEIESRLLSHPQITAVVVLPQRKQDDHYLTAWYISQQPLPPTTLRSYLKQSLPDHMIPAFFVPIAGLPLTVNGKLDTKALPSPDPAIDDDFVSPVNAVEEKLTEIWAAILHLDKERIGTQVNFFDLGGHSFGIIKLYKSIEDHFSLTIPVRTLFRLSTIRALASFIMNGEEKTYDGESGLADRGDALELLGAHLN
jgi:acyl carrier protein